MSRKTPTSLAIAEASFTAGYWLACFFNLFDDYSETAEAEGVEEQEDASGETSG